METNLNPEKKRFKLCIAVPAYNGVNLTYFLDFLSTALNNAVPEADLTFCARGGDGLVGRVRNNIAAFFLLQTECDALLQIDTDIDFGSFHVRRILWHLMHGKDVVGGLYAAKDPKATRWVLSELPGELPDPVTGIRKVFEIGTGFLGVNRRVFEKMMKEVPNITYLDDAFLDRPMRWNFFPSEVANNRLLSEDYGFCHLAKKCGFDIWADTGCELGHEGMIRYPLAGTKGAKFPPDAPDGPLVQPVDQPVSVPGAVDQPPIKV
jgi:hypothetical protein